MTDRLADPVRTKAMHACEYCRLSEDCHPGVFEVEHVIAKKHGGPTTLAHLAYSCLHWNVQT
jgi:hypothetical protein